MSQHIDPGAIAVFVNEAKGYLPEIMLGLECFAADPEQAESIRAACRYSEKINGGAGILGLERICKAGLELQGLLELVSSGMFPVSNELLEQLCQNITDIAELLECVEIPPPLEVGLNEGGSNGESEGACQTGGLEPATLDETMIGCRDFFVSFPDQEETPTIGDLDLGQIARHVASEGGVESEPASFQIPTELVGSLPEMNFVPDEKTEQFEPILIDLPERSFSVVGDVDTVAPAGSEIIEDDPFTWEAVISAMRPPEEGVYQAGHSEPEETTTFAASQPVAPLDISLPIEDVITRTPPPVDSSSFEPPATLDYPVPGPGCSVEANAEHDDAANAEHAVEAKAEHDDAAGAELSGALEAELSDAMVVEQPETLKVVDAEEPLEAGFPPVSDSGDLLDEIPGPLDDADDLLHCIEQPTAYDEQVLEFCAETPGEVVFDSGDELIGTFLMEADQHFQAINAALRLLENSPGDRDAVHQLRRSAHSLKGTTGMLGFEKIMQFIHRMEDILDLIYNGALRPVPRVICLLQESTLLLEELSRGSNRDDLVSEMYLQFEQVTETASEIDTGNQENVSVKSHEMLAELPSGHLDANAVGDFAIGFPTFTEEDFSSGSPSTWPASNMVADTSMVPSTGHHTPFVDSAYADIDDEAPLNVAAAVTSSMVAEHQADHKESTHEVECEPVHSIEITPSQSGRFIRVPTERLDEVAGLISDMITARAGFEERMGDLSRHVEDLEVSGARLSRASAVFERRIRNSAQSRPQQMSEPPAPLSTHNELHSDPRAKDVRTLAVGEEIDRVAELSLISRDLTEASRDIQTLGRELSNISNEFLTNLNRQGRIYGDFQDRLMRLRMLPFGSVAQRLHRAVRSVSSLLGRQVELVLEGESTAIETITLQEMMDPIVHLLRNAVDHGIEPPEERRASGKSSLGRIVVRAFYEGSQIAIQVSDDGRGLDPDKIRDTAVRTGCVSAVAAAALAPHELWSLIFNPGFTTALKVTQVSGRGVGMDVVYTAVQRLKGNISVDSDAGRGTSFTVRLPMTIAITRALLVKSGKQTFAVPLDIVTQVMRIESSRIERLVNEPVIRIGAKLYPVLLLSRLANLKGATRELEARPPALLLCVEGREVVVIVDGLFGGREIVIKSLGDHLRKVHGVMGATLLGDGSVVLILNIAELLRGAVIPAAHHAVEHLVAAPAVATPLVAASAIPTAVPALANRPAETAAPRVDGEPHTDTRQILIIDDSPSVRRVGSNLVKAIGWTPIQAKDGLDAFEKLQTGEVSPDLILLDIEMPRMDGYQLLTTLRSMAAYRDLPIVIASSRTGEKHRQKAFELGATDYIGKPFNEAQIKGLLQRLLCR